jgi:putative nucleotidyltransferase with HDIG domain
MPHPAISQIKFLIEKIAKQNGIPSQAFDTWRHSQCVWRFAQKISKLARKNGYKVNLQFLKLACFAHDLGRMQTGSKGSRKILDAVYHGYLGYKLARKFGFPKELAEVCRRHLAGTGLSATVNKKFKIGKRATFVRTLEEKILGYADCRTFNNKIAPFSRAYNRFKKYPGQGPRLLKLQKFIEKITNNEIK